MRRFYYHVADKLRYFTWGRTLVDHVGRRERFYENFEALYTALILALIIKSFIVEAYKIPSKSILDTLMIDDRIFVNKFLYNFTSIEVGDVIVFKTENIANLDYEEKPYYIKRVVGLPGDEIDVRSGHLYRNGTLIDDPGFFLKNRYFPSLSGRKAHFTVPDDKLYVFGDNSLHSYDSREWGGVPLENVMGKAFFRYWPLSRMGLIRGVPPEDIRERVAEDESRSSSGAHAATP